MGETIGISEVISIQDISSVLREVFPDLNFEHVDIKNLPSLDEQPTRTIYFATHRTNSEFPIRIELYKTPNGDTDAREQYIASRISEIAGCRTIVGYQEGDFRTSPFHSLIFDRNEVYLATDINSRYSGDGDDKIKIQYKLDLRNNHKFDRQGNLDKRDPT